MKQLLQSIRSGDIVLHDVPSPQVRASGLLVRTRASLISPGTERMTLEFSQKSLIGKARSRPDLVRQVLDKARRDGFVDAARAAFSRLDRPSAPGYACAGTVIAVGPDASSQFAVGDAVACAGTGYATHAEVNYVPRNLAIPVPRRASGDSLGFDEAAFAPLGAIALHAARLGGAQVGDRVAVVGLGLIGLLAGQILRASGCRVLGIEPQVSRRQTASHVGIEAVAIHDAHARMQAMTDGHGADLVVITAATADSQPAQLAARIARDRARVVVVGATGLELPRRDYYQKELELVVARSYGPGRYDRGFEEEGRDYPRGYVRWTERENMRAFLELVADDRVAVAPLITDRVAIDDGPDAYERLSDSRSLAIVLEYDAERRYDDSKGPFTCQSMVRVDERPAVPGDRVGVSVIGAGTFATSVLLPALRRIDGVTLEGVASRGGTSARAAADRFGFRFCDSSADALLSDPGTDAVVIATRHNEHASLAEAALRAGKRVFVEKPLCLRGEELASLVALHARLERDGRRPFLMVGFNRRFSPLAGRARAWVLGHRSPVTIAYRVNAGRLPIGSWIADPAEGGGRVISEFCHFVDLAGFLADSRVTSVFARRASRGSDDVVTTLEFENGSLATLTFTSEGDRAFAKERIEVFCGGGLVVIDDFRRAWEIQNGRRRRLHSFMPRQRKGHAEELAAFVSACRSGAASPVPFDDAVHITRAILAIERSISAGIAVDL